MIPTKSEVDIQGTLPGEDVQMTLDAGSLAHLMSVLTNLYSDKTLAIVREYSTNALDSHIEAGVNRPIEVSTPTDFKPFFTVRDYGVGMDAETIRNVYSRYGASTKRETNSQNGMLGLGSKSALTYTSQFKVIGVKDGVKTYVLVSRDVDGSGVMKIISQSNTDESNGVTIEIPVANRRDIENAAFNFFRFWKPGTVLLNGKDPSLLEGIHLGKFTITDRVSGDHIVMGNVAYPVPETSRIFKNYYARTSVVAYVDMGEINFTPSREALHMTELTKNTLNELRKEFEGEVKKYIEEKIDNASSHAEALKNYFEIQGSNLGTYATNLKYKGEIIPTSFEFDIKYYIGTGTASSGMHTDARKLMQSKCVIVHGYKHEKLHTAHRTKIKLWLEENNKENTSYVFFTEKTDSPKWLADVPQVNWDDIRKIKLERAKTGDAKKDVYDAINANGYRISGQQIDLNKEIIYSSPVDFASDESRSLVARFITNDPNNQLVLVNKNRWNAFVKDIPKAVHIDAKVGKIIDDYLKSLTNEEKMYLRSDWKDRHFCARLNPDKILDPDVKAAIKAFKASGLSDSMVKKYELMQVVARHWNISFPNLTSGGERLFEKYPLLDVYGYHSVNHHPIEHVYLYMNVCYTNLLLTKGNNQ